MVGDAWPRIDLAYSREQAALADLNREVRTDVSSEEYGPRDSPPIETHQSSPASLEVLGSLIPPNAPVGASNASVSGLVIQQKRTLNHRQGAYRTAHGQRPSRDAAQGATSVLSRALWLRLAVYWEAVLTLACRSKCNYVRNEPDGFTHSY